MNSAFIYFIMSASSFMARCNPKNDESGEGVVSAAIAVVIFSTLGVAMWLAFRSTMNTATGMVSSQVAQLAN